MSFHAERTFGEAISTFLMSGGTVCATPDAIVFWLIYKRYHSSFLILYVYFCY